jgi:hypothetical protein
LAGYRLGLELADADLLPFRFSAYADVMETTMQGQKNKYSYTAKCAKKIFKNDS